MIGTTLLWVSLSFKATSCWFCTPQAVAEVTKLRTALARMEGSADELRAQLSQAKLQMEGMVG